MAVAKSSGSRTNRSSPSGGERRDGAECRSGNFPKPPVSPSQRLNFTTHLGTEHCSHDSLDCPV